MTFIVRLSVILFILTSPKKAFVETASGHDVISEECGTILTAEDVEFLSTRDLAPTPKAFEALKAPLGMPLAIHVLRRSNGTGGLPEYRVAQAVADTNASYESTGMRFFIDGDIDYIDNDTYYEINSSQEANNLRNIYNVPYRVNLYFVDYALGYCGFSTFSWYTVQGIIVDNDCAGTPSNPSTVPHEIGHYFDLFHTHETAFGYECVNGSNCDSAGDQLCDTPADPNLSGKVDGFCQYTGTDLDPCNNDPYAPDPHNLMSYSQKTCRDYTSPLQDTKQVATVANFRPELLVLPDVKANSTDGPVNLNVGSPLTIEVALNAGVRGGDPAEWYIAAFTPFGKYWYTAVSSGWTKSDTPLPVGGIANSFFNLNPYIVLSSYNLNVPGSYMFGVALDGKVNGTLDLQYYDIVDVVVQ